MAALRSRGLRRRQSVQPARPARAGASLALALLCLLGLLGLPILQACGSEPVSEPAPTSQTSGAEQPGPRRGMQVEGLMGTIPERKILATLEPKLPRFQRCFFQGSEQVEFIGGVVEFYFRVGLDGRVEWVYLRDSSVGHLPTERCLLEEASRARFPEPKGGGAAELSWGFELDPLEGARPPVAWDQARVADVLASHAADFEACGSGRFVVTAYVDPGGQVRAAGAAADSIAAAQGSECIVDVVRGLAMPDPGSYPAKVSFTLP